MTTTNTLFVVTIFRGKDPGTFLVSMACATPGPKLGIESVENLRACLERLGVDHEVVEVPREEEPSGERPGTRYWFEWRALDEIIERARDLTHLSAGLTLVTKVSSQQEAAVRAERCVYEKIARLAW